MVFNLWMAALSVDRRGRRKRPGFIYRAKMQMKLQIAFQTDHWKQKSLEMKSEKHLH